MNEADVLAAVTIYSSSAVQNSGRDRVIYFFLEPNGKDFLGGPYPRQVIGVEMNAAGEVARVVKGDG
jgi:hypothetical protein